MKEFKVTKTGIKAIPLMKGELWYIQNFNKMSHVTQIYRNILYFICAYSVKIFLSTHQSFTVRGAIACQGLCFP